jgi:hypothetical protein
MSYRIIKILIFAYVIFFVAIDISTITKLILFAKGLPRDWGLLGRLFLPLIFVLVSLKTKDNNAKFALYFFATARFLYYNSIIFYDKINFAVITIILVFFMDILSLFQSIKIDKLSLIQKTRSLKVIKISLIIIGLFCAALISTVLLMGKLGHP